MIRNILLSLTNNILTNNIVIFLGLDAFVNAKIGIYQRIRIDKTLPVDVMAGFSNNEEVIESRNKTKDDLKKIISTNLKPGASFLDIGCGAGSYLKEFSKDFKCSGIDINVDMIEKGKEYVPNAEFIFADFMSYQFNKKFDLIYSVSVMEFITPSKIEKFFSKIHDLLNESGVLFIHYPHALRKMDLYYPDLTYIEYSPLLIEKIVKNNFEIVEHKHGYDDRKVKEYDEQPYNRGKRTFKNGYLLIALKKTN